MLNNTVYSIRLGGFSLGRYNWSVNCSDTNTPILMNVSPARFFYYNDTEAPNITLNTPTNNSVILDNNQVTFNWTAIDSFSATFPCTLRINAVNNVTNTSTNNTATLNVQQMPYQYINWTVNCTDSLGNARTSSTFWFNNTKTTSANIQFNPGIGGLVFNPNLATATYTLVKNASGIATSVTNITSWNNSAQNQTASVGVFNISSNLTPSQNNITFNLTSRSGGPADLKCGNTSSAGNAVNITTASVVVIKIAPNLTHDLWCWMDYINATSQFTFTLNTGQQ